MGIQSAIEAVADHESTSLDPGMNNQRPGGTAVVLVKRQTGRGTRRARNLRKRAARRFPPPQAGISLAGLMVMWEITITCRDGSRLRLSERRDHAPLQGRHLRHCGHRADNQGEDRHPSRRTAGWLAPSLFPGHGDRDIKSAKVTTPAAPLRPGRDKEDLATDRRQPQNLCRCRTACDAE
jgi:hypothetical protein